MEVKDNVDLTVTTLDHNIDAGVSGQEAPPEDQKRTESGPGGVEEGEIIFIGTGTSEGIPIVSCLTRGCDEGDGQQAAAAQRCQVCFDAVRTDIRSRNYRRNTSLMIRWARPSSTGQDGGNRDVDGADNADGTDDATGAKRAVPARTHTNVLIDCGKFFWASALEWFPHHRVRYIDALLLTHRHNDACYGLDDLRDWSRMQQDQVEVYLREDDLTYLNQPFPYLVDTSTATIGGGVAQLKWTTIQPYLPFNIHGLTITPLEIVHGNTPMFGFMFGEVVYLSDVNGIPDRTRELIKGCGLLIIDMLRLKEAHSSHFILDETLAEIRLIRPRRALLVGMNHTVPHDSTNELLRELMAADGIDVQLAYDGQRLPVRLS